HQQQIFIPAHRSRHFANCGLLGSAVICQTQMAGVEDALKEELATLLEEREKWKDERSRLGDEIETLRSRVQKLALAAGQTSDLQRVDAEVQTEVTGEALLQDGGASGSSASAAE
ncbi:unnamed protein product, partial [Polarella glacialis]